MDIPAPPFPPTRTPPQVLQRVSAYIDRTLGLYYPERRYRDLERALSSACGLFGYDDVARCAHWLADGALSDEELRTLAGQLTTSETYFFREAKTLEVLRRSVLPVLISRYGEAGRTLRLWSAGCCTGEEAYTLAIMLHRLLPSIRNWNVSVLATDVNADYLERAERGVYREWSFRGAPKWLRSEYFTAREDGSYEIAPYIKEIVRFRQLNLRSGGYPSLSTDTGGMDVILCRNVFIYFSRENVRAIAGRFRECLNPDGWLVTSPTEGAVMLDMGVLEPVHFPEALLFRNSEGERSGPACPLDAEPGPLPWEDEDDFGAGAAAGAEEDARQAEPPGMEETLRLLAQVGARAEPDRAVEEEPPAADGARLEASARACEEGRYMDAVRLLEGDAASRDASDAGRAAVLLATCHANLGDLDEAAAWCDRAVEAAGLDPCVHYLRATVCQERGEVDEARLSLERAVYLDQDFIMAHFLLGNLERAVGDEAWRKRFKAGLAVLEGRDLDEAVPHSDGMSAGRLAEIMQGALEA